MFTTLKSLIKRLIPRVHPDEREEEESDLERSFAGSDSGSDSGYESDGSDPGGTDEVEEHSYLPERYGFSPSHLSQSDIPFNETFPEDTIVIYTDASCGNFRVNPDNAYAGFFGHEHPLNFAERLNPTTTGVLSVPRPSRPDFVEILAAIEALTRLKNWNEYSDQDVIVRTDNLHMIKALNGQPQGFPNEIERLRNIASSFPNGVRFQHVFAHNGDPGNEKVDGMVGHAMRTGIKYVEPPPIIGKEKRRRRSTSRSNSKYSNCSTASTFTMPTKRR